jgi:hypothetical protein
MLVRSTACINVMVKLFSLFKKQTALGTDTHRTAAPPHAMRTTQTDWSRLRRQQRREDQVLSGSTYAWLKTLPYAVRPIELCSRYPRVGNRLALCWSDPAQTERLFDDLLLDRRGKRKGFPSSVAEELVHLCRFHDRHRGVEDQSTDWDFRSPISDR